MLLAATDSTARAGSSCPPGKSGMPNARRMLQAAQKASERAAEEQHALDIRKAQLDQHDSQLKELDLALHTRHAELQHKQHQLQVCC